MSSRPRPAHAMILNRVYLVLHRRSAIQYIRAILARRSQSTSRCTACIVVAIMLVISGCSSTSSLRIPEDPTATTHSPEGLNSFREDVQGKRVRVTRLDDHSVDGWVRSVTVDSLVLRSPACAFSLLSIKTVVRKKTARGALDGAGIGFLTGFGSGFVIGLSSGGSGMTVMSPAASGALGGTILGILGIPIGTAVGAVRKHRRTWVFNHSTPEADAPPVTSMYEMRYNPDEVGD